MAGVQRRHFRMRESLGVAGVDSYREKHGPRVAFATVSVVCESSHHRDADGWFQDTNHQQYIDIFLGIIFLALAFVSYSV